VDSASFVVATLFLLELRPRGRSSTSGERPSAYREIRDGVRGLVAVPAVRAYALLNAALSLGWGGIVALLVVYVRDDLGRPGGEYGIVLAFAGLGTVVSSLVIASRDARHSRGPWAVASVLGLGTFLAILVKPPLVALLPIALVAGLADAGVGIPLSATLAETLPDALRGRAYSVVAGLTELASAVGSVGLAWLGDSSRLGVVNAMALSAGIGCALAVAVLAAGGANAIRRNERNRLGVPAA